MIENNGAAPKLMRCGSRRQQVAGGEARLWPSRFGRPHQGVAERQLGAPKCGSAHDRMHEQSTASVEKLVGNGWGPERAAAYLRRLRWIAR
jgi:hypothetical protein